MRAITWCGLGLGYLCIGVGLGLGPGLGLGIGIGLRLGLELGLELGLRLGRGQVAGYMTSRYRALGATLPGVHGVDSWLG